MTRPAPQYGEYATPDEQRRLAGLPPIDVVDADEQHEAHQEATEEAKPQRSRGDLLVTVALLAYGLVNVLSSAISYLDLPAVLDQMLDIVGAEGSFTQFTVGRIWGGVAAVAMLVGYGMTVLVAVRRLRRGVRAWWVPIVGAALTVMVVSICVMVPVLADPAFLDALGTATIG